MNTAKQIFGITFVTLFVLATFVGISTTAQAAGSTAIYASYTYPSSGSSNGNNSQNTTTSSNKGSTAVYATYTYPSTSKNTQTTTTSTKKGSTAVYATYTYPSTNSSTGVTHYDTGCCTQPTTGKGSTAIYATYTYPATTPTYSTPTYTPSTYTTITYTGGCTGNCGGGTTVITYPYPTCSVSVNKSTISAGDMVTVSWSSTNATWGNIANLGTNLPMSGSHSVVLANTTTFTGTFGGNGGTTNCSATVYVTPKPAPVCTITGPDTATAGQTITLNWSSANATYGNIDNLGTNLPASGSRSFVINNSTTFTGTFFDTNGQTTTCQKTVTVSSIQYCPAGYSGTYPNCYPPVQYCPAGYSGTYPNCYIPQQNSPSCTITINNYGNNYNNGYWTPNSAVTLSWNSSNASSGYINNSFGNVGLSGSRTIYPTQTTTYTGTFYGYNGQSVTCSATVYVGNTYVPPVNPNTPFIMLSAVPYTGLELGPVGTVLYWGFLAFWCALAAYLIVVKKVQNQVYASLKTVLFGAGASHAAHTAHVAHTTHAAHDTHEVHEDRTDDFIMSQINRVRA